MKKFAIASHAKMAEGIQSTLELFAGKDLDVTYMSAYVEDAPEIEEQIATFFDNLKDEDQAVIFTDMFGGSVNQKMTLAAQDKENVFIVAGFNLPVIIEIIYGADVYTRENIQALLENGKDAMQLVANVAEATPAVAETEVVAEEVAEEKVEAPVLDGIIPTTLRVDERLIHGQIAMVWSRELNLQGILVANDQAAENETQQMALKMAVPSGINVLIRSIDDVAEILKEPRAKTRRMLVLVRTVGDALRLAKKVPNMSYLNIGNVGKAVEGDKQTLTQFVMLTPEEMQSLGKLVEIYPEAALQNVPADKKELASSFVK
ncbi:PTS mannose/fructose/sorbose transporter subunit IIAB [Enterococcus olivae]